MYIQFYIYDTYIYKVMCEYTNVLLTHELQKPTCLWSTASTGVTDEPPC